MQQKVIETTLGDLIVAVTDEVKPFVRDPSALYMVVFCILDDVLARHHLRVHERSRRKYPGCLAKTVHSLLLRRRRQERVRGARSC
jgi:hypothetical protein